MTKQLDQYLLDQVVRLAQPLQAASAGPDATLRLAAALGWNLGAIAGVPTTQLAGAVSAATAAFSDVAQTVEQGPADLAALAEALISCANAFASLRQIVQGWLVVSASELMRPEWSWLRTTHQPIARVADTLFVYQFP